MTGFPPSQSSRKSHVSRIGSQMRDDDIGITDWIDRKRRGLPFGHGRAQSLGRLPDRKGKGRILLNPPQMVHHISAPRWLGRMRQPRFRSEGDRAPSTDPRLALVAGFPGHVSRAEFLINQCGARHKRNTLLGFGLACQ